jgi:hypothetical protein
VWNCACRLGMQNVSFEPSVIHVSVVRIGAYRVFGCEELDGVEWSASRTGRFTAGQRAMVPME